MSPRRGYSLIELLMTMLLGALLLTLALPSMGILLHRWRMREACHILAHSAYAARSTAIYRGRPVWLCPSADQLHCQSRSQWQDGWLLMTGDGPAAEPVRLRVQPGFQNLRIQSSQGRRRLRFQADGHAEGSNLTWTVCSEHHPRQQARVVVSRGGRVRIESRSLPGTASCP